MSIGLLSAVIGGGLCFGTVSVLAFTATFARHVDRRRKARATPALLVPRPRPGFPPDV